MNGCTMVSPLSKAAYNVSIVLLLASSLPSWRMDLEFSYSTIRGKCSNAFMLPLDDFAYNEDVTQVIVPILIDNL